MVTGGSRGIGAATAPLLAAAGLDVCLSYRADARPRPAVVDGLPSGAAARRRPCAADVRDEADVLALFEAADELGPLGVLVNNAGITGPKARRRRAHRRAHRGPARRQRARRVPVRPGGRAPHVHAHGGAGGSIVNVSSAAARLGSPGEYVDYAATKGAIDTMTLGLAKEVAHEGIRVNAVRPGLIKTDIHARGGQPDRVEERRDTVPLGRGGEADEVAAGHRLAVLGRGVLRHRGAPRRERRPVGSAS